LTTQLVDLYGDTPIPRSDGGYEAYDSGRYVLLVSGSRVRVAVGARGAERTDLTTRTDQLKAGQIDEEGHTQQQGRMGKGLPSRFTCSCW
jgi:hypothetical protein